MIRGWMVSCVIVLGNLLAFRVTFAADAALVELEPPKSVSISAGERASFSVLLLAQGRFNGPTYFDLPEIENAILMQVSERPTLGTEEISGETYVSARYDFSVYAQRAGAIQVSPITVRFGSKYGFDQPAIAHRLQTERFDIEVSAPPGARAGEAIVSTRELRATETWSPEPARAQVGDAFTRTITIRARDVPAMMLPPPDIVDVPGFSIYPKPPKVSDETERGNFTGVRVDTVTYICERAGSFEIPELSVRWWDPDQEQWQSKSFPALSLEVTKNPLLKGSHASRAGAARLAGDMKSWIGWMIALLTILILVRFARTPLKRSWQGWRVERAASEPAQWRRLRRACRRGKAAEVYHELNRWLVHFGLSSYWLTTDIAVTGEMVDGVSEDLRNACIALQQQLAGLEIQWDLQILSDELTALRRQLRAASDATTAQALPLLNP